MPSLSVVSDSVTPWAPHGGGTKPVTEPVPARFLCLWDSPGKNTGVHCHALLQGIFPTQGSNPGLPHCRQILYCLSHQGSPRILEWVAYPFLLHGIFLTQELNWGLLHCRRILYQLSYQGSSLKTFPVKLQAVLPFPPIVPSPSREMCGISRRRQNCTQQLTSSVISPSS